MTETVWIAQTTVGAIFVASGLIKLRHREAFRAGVVAYRILPRRLTGPVAQAIPVAELMIGGLMWLGPSAWAVPAACLALLGAFAFGAGVNVVRRRPIPCYCFGPNERDKVGTATLVRIAFLASAAAVVVAGPRVDTLATLQSLSPSATVSLLGLWGAATAIVLVIAPGSSLVSAIGDARRLPPPPARCSAQVFGL